MPDLSPLRVFLVDDDPRVRSGWQAMLKLHVEVVGETDNADSAIELILERSPNVVLLDVQLSGAERVAREITERNSDVKLLAVSVSADRADVMRVIAAGATGYITKTADTAALLEAIERVAEGRPVFSADLAGFVFELIGAKDADLVAPEVLLLSTQELEILRLVARGLTYREIGEELFISVKTVETYMSHILRKLWGRDDPPGAMIPSGDVPDQG